MDGIIVKAVKEAIRDNSDYWSLKLPEGCTEGQEMSLKNAYYGNFAASYRENGCEHDDSIIMKAAANALKTKGVRGLCFSR